MRTHPRLRVAGEAKTYGGVDVAGRSKAELLDLARRLGVKVRSNMTKDELGDAIAAANREETHKRAAPSAESSPDQDLRLRRRWELNPRPGFCRPLPEPLGYAAVGTS